MKNSNKKNNNNALILLAGAAIGAAATYYLNTPGGKRVTQNAISKSQEIGTSIAEKAQLAADDAKIRANSAIASVSDSFNNAKETIKGQSASLMETAESKVSSFREGINKAKNSIDHNETIVS